MSVTLPPRFRRSRRKFQPPQTEINTAIGELASTTQRNAAMGKQATASCRSLAVEGSKLTNLLRKFVFRDVATQGTSDDPTHSATAEATSRSASSQNAA
ncbi:MAG: hypothetical protein WA889_00530 [Xanthobacteraceae bacterium]